MNVYEKEKRPDFILIVDTEVTAHNVLSGFLVGRGYDALAVSPDEAVPRLTNSRAGAVILNLSSGTNLLDVLATIRAIDAHVPILVIADRQQCALVEQEKPSVVLIGRPFDGRDLEAALASALRRHAAGRGRDEPASSSLDAVLLGRSPKMAAVRDLVARVADSDVTVLVRGETGTGKELVARGLRAASRRRDNPFVKVNCAALPADLLESELFGFERGAFTGALQSKPGKFEAAHQGTIFLDEIGEMSAALQAKLLQVLQDGEFSRVGGLTEIHVDARVVAATNCDLELAVANGTFRDDLYFRINVVNINLPPLRDRSEDVPLLIDHFLRRQNEAAGRSIEISDETLALLRSYSWPGNVRELENLIKRIVVLGSEDSIGETLAERRWLGTDARPGQADEAAPSMAEPADPSRSTSLKEIGRTAAREAERIAILEMLERTRWNRKEAAEILGISYKALLYKIKHNRLDEAS